MFSSFAPTAGGFGQLGAAFGSNGAGGTGVYEQAALYMDFRNNAARLSGVWSSANSLLTTARASVAQMDTSDGWWGEFAANTPRWSDKGLLVEEARTNGIRNNTMAGAVAGTPGTLPSAWAINLAGLTQQVVAVGNDHGIDYVDLRVFGTTTSGACQIFFDQPTGIPAANGQTWTASVFWALAGGSFANILSLGVYSAIYAAGPSYIGDIWTPTAVNTLPSTLVRRAETGTITLGTAASVVPYVMLQFSIGVAVDITLRIGWPQMEQGAFPTSPIKTSAAAATRAADVIDVAAFVPTNPASLFAEVMLPGFMAGTYCGAILISGAVPDNDRQSLIVFGTNLQGILDCTVGTVNQANLLGGSATAGQPFKYAGATAVNDFALSTSGAAVLTDATGSLVAAPTKIVIGRAFASTFFANSYIRRVAYWSSRLSNALLQAMTAP